MAADDKLFPVRQSQILERRECADQGRFLGESFLQRRQTERAAADYLASPEGQRQKREAESRARAEDLGRTPLALRDTYDKVVSETAAAGHTIVNAISGAGEPSTVDLSPKSAAAIGEATANALRQRPPEIKLPLLSDPNAFKGN
mgnify:CR=1 FL=1